MEKDRLNHSLAVANKMIELGKDKYNITDNNILQDLFILGLVHDIGYEFMENNEEHNVVGGNILKNNGYKYWQEVYFHGNPNTDYTTIFLDILNDADMQIDKYGNDVGYKKRLEDIENRYGIESIPYTNSYKIIKNIKTKNRRKRCKKKIAFYNFLKKEILEYLTQE